MDHDPEENTRQDLSRTNDPSGTAENTEQQSAQLPDDLAALLSHASLNQGSYKEFNFGVRRTATAAKSQPSAAENRRTDLHSPERSSEIQPSAATANRSARTSVRWRHRTAAEEHSSSSATLPIPLTEDEVQSSPQPANHAIHPP